MPKPGSTTASSEASTSSSTASDIHLRVIHRIIPISPISASPASPNVCDITPPLSCLTSYEISPFSRLSDRRAKLNRQRAQLEERINKATGSIHSPSSVERDHVLVKRQQFPCCNGRCAYIYTGPVHNETKLPHGIGEMRYANGQVYRGNLFHGARHGHGENKWPTRGDETQIYRGAWQQDSRHGRGTQEWINVSDGHNTRVQSATGFWRNGHLHGRVCMEWRDGSSYNGDVECGKRHGRGIQTWKRGKVYSGQYRNNVEDGFGTLTDVEKHTTYRGNFRNGKRHGAGVQMWKNKTYDGQWEKNKVHGNGTLTGKDGAKYTGNFDRGKFHGSGCYTDKVGNKYMGNFSHGKKHGSGKEYLINGDVYSGTFVQGRRHEYGRLTSADGRSYAGGWFNGKKSGRGIEMSADGKVEHCGVFADNSPLSLQSSTNISLINCSTGKNDSTSMCERFESRSTISRIVVSEGSDGELVTFSEDTDSVWER